MPCWRFYVVPTARVIFTAKTSSDVFGLSQEQVWTLSVLGDRIYELRSLCTDTGSTSYVSRSPLVPEYCASRDHSHF